VLVDASHGLLPSLLLEDAGPGRFPNRRASAFP
jgi:hypothetical protein